MKETEKAYIAALIDCRGSISIPKHGSGRLRLIVQITMKSPLALEWVQGHLGGAVLVHTGSYGKDTPYYRWSIYGLAAQEFLEEIYPYLRARQEHADVAIEFPHVGKEGRLTEEQKQIRQLCREEMQELNNR